MRPGRALAGGLVAAGVVGVVLAAWAAHRVLLAVFLGVLLGILVDALARGVARLSGLSRRWAARLVVVVLLGGGAAAVAFLAPPLSRELNRLVDAVPALLAEVGRTPWGARLVAALGDQGVDGPALGAITEQVALGAVELLLAVTIGAVLGASPRRHAAAVVALLPPSARRRAIEVGEAIHTALRHWLVGRVVDMAILTVSTTLGLWLVGLPYAPALGLLAGVLEFVPYIGPTVSVIPAALVALAVEPGLVVDVVLVYGVVQLVQSYLVTPLIEQRAVHVPPAAVLAVQGVMAVLAGAMGVLVAVPLVVVLIVLVQVLYLRGALRQEVRLLGDR